jgi:hypothetical protein
MSVEEQYSWAAASADVADSDRFDIRNAAPRLNAAPPVRNFSISLRMADIQQNGSHVVAA